MNKAIRLFICGAVALIAGTMVSCTDYQDEINALDTRVNSLEALTNEVNTNLSSVTTIINAMNNGDFITGLTNIPNGYVIHFSKFGDVTILNGEKGADASAPNISVKLDESDNNYYWAMDGEFILVNGQKVRVTGEKGEDAVSPQVKIDAVTMTWWVSTDGGQNWIDTGMKVTGSDGADADSKIIKAIPDYVEGYVVITLPGNPQQELKIPFLALVYADSVRFTNVTNHSLALAVGGVFSLKAKVYPANANQGVVYYIDSWNNPGTTYANAISVNIDGKIEAKAACTVRIRAIAKFTKDNNDVNAQDWVNVSVE